MRRRWAIGLLLTLLIASARPAFACSCAPLTKAQMAGDAQVIFTGLVTEVTLSRGLGSVLGCGGSSLDPLSVRFQVDTVYRGDLTKDVVVETAMSEASCGFTFETGRTYTVFGTRNEGHIDTGLCRGTIAGAIVAGEYGLPAGRPPAR